jgi:hypothetical protein
VNIQTLTQSTVTEGIAPHSYYNPQSDCFFLHSGLVPDLPFTKLFNRIAVFAILRLASSGNGSNGGQPSQNPSIILMFSLFRAHFSTFQQRRQ